MPISDFFPMVSILGNYNSGMEDWEFNNQDEWTINWTVYDASAMGASPTINSIACGALIDTFTDLSEENRQAMKDEIVLPSLCPDITSFQLEGDSLRGSQSFNVEVIPVNSSTAADAPINNTIIISSAISRYFEPDEYLE